MTTDFARCLKLLLSRRTTFPSAREKVD